MSTSATPPTAPPSATIHPPAPSEYKLSEHAPIKPSRGSDPALRAAFERVAGKAPARETPPGEAKIIPAQPPRPPAPEALAAAETAPDAPTSNASASDDKPAPHVKFIPSDERPPVVAPAAPAIAEPPPEVVKSASAQLREAFEKLKSDFTAKATEGDLTKKELATYRAKALGYEERIKSLESIEGRAKELEKQVLTYDEQLRVTNYIQHPEFHEKYVKPVADALTSARSMVQELMVTQEDGTRRMGNVEDFNTVLAQPNYTLALDKAVELFGERMGQAVFEESRRVKTLRQSQAKAVETANANSLEWTKKQQESALQVRQKTRADFEAKVAALAQEHASLYLPADGDKEAAEARQGGEALAALAIHGAPEGMAPSAYLEKLAKVYHRASAFPMVDLARQRLVAEVGELRAKLAAYEKSSPDTSSAQRPPGITEIGATSVNGPDKYKQHARATLERIAHQRA